MKKLFLSLSFLLLTAQSIASFAHDGNPVSIITADDIREMVDEHVPFSLVDARREKDYQREHITNAISLSAINVNAQSLAENFPEKETKLIFYCQNPKCQASHIAANKASEVGYGHVYVYSAGIEDWKKRGYATTKLEESN